MEEYIYWEDFVVYGMGGFITAVACLSFMMWAAIGVNAVKYGKVHKKRKMD